MSHELSILITAAASIGFFHTLFGPDHYLPFIVMAQSGKWSLRKTTLITFLCGIGHVMSSVLLGIIGIVLGMVVSKLEIIEGFRGNLAAWALIAFGLVYFIWGMQRVVRNKPHQHLHTHQDAVSHIHTHVHNDEHVHVHETANNKNLTPWILFTIFVLGPCEPLIPLLMYPAAKNSLAGLISVVVIFGSITIATMLSVVIISTLGISFIPLQRIERYMHAFSGAAICLSGMAIQFLGL
ncbi:MAG: sulfite exporter TauE/SafE family protein [Calditrichia bacterium]|nr:sulfite exporter TauE/SafE family protein [Calditrichia bacterium]